MKSGCPPTALNARTGESTPPGNRRCAAAKSSVERSMFFLTIGLGSHACARCLSVSGGHVNECIVGSRLAGSDAVRNAHTGVCRSRDEQAAVGGKPLANV